jgi:hypothetical protein
MLGFNIAADGQQEAMRLVSVLCSSPGWLVWPRQLPVVLGAVCVLAAALLAARASRRRAGGVQEHALRLRARQAAGDRGLRPPRRARGAHGRRRRVVRSAGDRLVISVGDDDRRSYVVSGR